MSLYMFSVNDEESLTQDDRFGKFGGSGAEEERFDAESSLATQNLYV